MVDIHHALLAGIAKNENKPTAVIAIFSVKPIKKAPPFCYGGA